MVLYIPFTIKYRGKTYYMAGDGSKKTRKEAKDYAKQAQEDGHMTHIVKTKSTQSTDGKVYYVLYTHRKEAK